MAGLVVLLGVVVVLPIATNSATSAAPAPYSRAKLSCPRRAAAGSTVAISGTGLPANGAVGLTLDRATPLGSTTTDAQGAFTTNVVIPAATTKGSHTVTATVTVPGTTIVRSCNVRVT